LQFADVNMRLLPIFNKYYEKKWTLPLFQVLAM